MVKRGGLLVVGIWLVGLLSGAALAELADPTAPRQGPIKPQAAVRTAVVLPQLQSILFQKNYKSAVINNQTYQEGDLVAGYRIANIQAHYVLLKRNGHTTKLSLFNADFLK